MTLTIDASAIASNASAIRAHCEDVDLIPTAVIKAAYALPEIIRAVAAGGIQSFAASSSRSALAVSRIIGCDCGIVGASGLSRGEHLSPRISSVMIARPEEAMRLLAAGRQFVWLSLMTSDGRDGVTADRLPRVLYKLLAVPGATQRLGFALNWGCLGGPPGLAELTDMRQLLQDISSGSGELLPLSLGGSALLPLISNIDLPGARELRVGEAILTGNIPGGDGRRLGLRPPIRLSATVVDVQSRTGNARRLLLDRGWTSIEVTDVTLCGVRARPAAASAEVSLFDLTDEAFIPKVGQTVDLLLGYKSTLRALLNRTIPRQIRAYKSVQSPAPFAKPGTHVPAFFKNSTSTCD